MKGEPRIALIGYGRMGKELHAIIQERQWADPVLIDPQHEGAYPSISEAPMDVVDVCIEFTEPSAAHASVLAALSTGTPVVSGTTGWDHDDPHILSVVDQKQTAFMHASNFSIGVYIFSSIVEYAASLLGKFPQYDIGLHEAHHRGKKDVPSGTALMLADRILRAHPGKASAKLVTPGESLRDDTLGISAARLGSVFGEHRVHIDSDADGIELSHTAKGRRGFVEGAVTAAAWIIGKQGIFSLEDMIHDITAA